MTKLLPIYRIATQANEWLESLPESVRKNVLERSRLREVSAGHRLFSRGDVPDGIYRVESGCVRVCGVSGDGHETVLDFYGPKTWFGEAAMLDGSLRAFDTIVESHSTLLQIVPDVFEELLKQHPPFARGLLKMVGVRMRVLAMAIEAYSSQTLEQRLANRLLLLSSTFGIKAREGMAIELYLPQETLAQLIGATRQRVNQILKEWEAADMISHKNGRVVLRNNRWFKNLAEM